MSREPHNYHEDIDLFREALSFTQSETGFSARLDREGLLLFSSSARPACHNEPTMGIQGRDLPEQGPQRFLPDERGLGLRLTQSRWERPVLSAAR